MLKQRQKKSIELIQKQIAQDKVSHAYLLVGESDTEAVATYMAKSLFCTNYNDSPCNICESCIKVDEDNHSDYVLVSGQDKTISKEDVMNVKSRFLQTSLEDVKHKVYVIHDVDNASLVAMNSFLKFLEEPDSNIVAILTTSNINKVLETIKSRCLILNLARVDKLILEENLINEGLDPYNAKVLSFVSKDIKEALEIHDDKLFHNVIDTFHTMKRLYRKGQYVEAGIALQVYGIKTHKFNLKAIEWLCVLHELTYSIQGVDDTQQISLKDLELLKVSMIIKDRIRPGVISSMLIDQFVYELNKGL
ncbi:MAG: DNA polymerase III subunit delta' [Erysipelothrix sp.]|nr:DNA polymerase III subunit delta' [Erysipelothrix sp.]